MTGPQGDQHKGYWRVTEVEPPSRLALEELRPGPRQPNDDLLVRRVDVRIEMIDDVHTRMTITSVYDPSANLQQVLPMGMKEGIRTAVGQIDALLAEG